MPGAIGSVHHKEESGLAEAAPEQAVGKGERRRARVAALAPFDALGISRLPPRWWLPPLLLALGTVLALVVAYSARPAVRIDLGDYYNSAFLSDFHGREVGAAAAGTADDWPPGRPELELPGRRAGVWLATVHAAPALPDDALRDVALAVNDTRVSVVRRGPRQIVAVIPPEVGAAERLVLELVAPVTGGEPPPAGLAGRVELAPAQTYRWSQGSSTISLPGLGRGDWQVTLAATVHHPDGAPLDAIVAANGVPIARLPDRGEARRLHLLVPGALVPDGDLTLGISSRTYQDPRPLGVLISEVSAGPAGPVALAPPGGTLLYALVIALGLLFCLARTTGRPMPAAALALALVLVGAWSLAGARYPAALMLPRLAALTLWSAGLLLALERLLPWAFRRAGVPLSPGLLRGMLLVFFASYWLKAGGMLYPYFIGIDVSWHLDHARTLLNGQLGRYYGTGSPLNELTMPVGEWGANRPVIPYSPWFHIFAGVFLVLPVPAVLAAHMFSALVDCSRVFLIGLLGRKLGLGERESLLAGLLYAVTPATFLLHSWGNIPTTFGMWWTLVSTVYIVVAYRQLDRRGPFITLTLLLLATLLFYTVMAVFMLLFLGLLVAALWLVDSARAREATRSRKIGRETTRDALQQTDLRVSSRSFLDRFPRQVVALGLASAVALGLATLIYCGQYIGPILERTIPYFTQAAAPSGGIEGVRHDPFGVYLAKYWPRMTYFRQSGSYGLQLALPLGLLGMLYVRGRRSRALLACWLAVAALFLVAGNRISMVDKHLFYIIPALALGVGLLMGRLWRRGAAARLVVACFYAFALVAALDMWVYRILTVRQ